MKTYMCGFLFDWQGNVALVRKAKPAWQKDKLNGVGGKIEEGETPREAMRREFLEEAGQDHVDWDEFLVLSGPEWRVHFFRIRGQMNTQFVSLPGEPVNWYYSRALPKNTIPNLSWIIPLALDDNTRLASPAQVVERQ